MESFLVNTEYLIFLVPLFGFLILLYADNNTSSRFDQCVVDLILHLVLADKSAQQEELVSIKEHFFSFNLYLSNQGKAYEKLNQKLKDSRAGFSPSLRNVDDICSNFLQECPLDYRNRLAILDSLFQIAYAHQGVSDEELSVLERISRRFVIKEWDLISLKYKYEYVQAKTDNKERRQRSENEESAENKGDRFQRFYDARHKEAYAVLGLNVGADIREIKTAYRSLVKQCHPDMLSPNLSNEEKELYLARFRHIQEAYDCLMEEDPVVLYS